MSYETQPAPLRYGEAVLPPPALTEPRMLPAEIPSGVQVVTLPSGARTLAYAAPGLIALTEALWAAVALIAAGGAALFL
ncbi:hypothetical protein ADK61_02455, partial [Streptomyces sp. XY66]